MQKSSLKLYFSTFVFILALTSFTFAGNDHCPIAPPPPTDENGRIYAVTTAATPAEADDYRFIRGIWELLLLKTDLF